MISYLQTFKHDVDLSHTERLHRAIHPETTTGAMLPKRCACGKPAHAKQLAQYGVCIACQWDARVASLEPEDHGILRFMLGVKQSPRSQWACVTPSARL